MPRQFTRVVYPNDCITGTYNELPSDTQLSRVLTILTRANGLRPMWLNTFEIIADSLALPHERVQIDRRPGCIFCMKDYVCRSVDVQSQAGCWHTQHTRADEMENVFN